MIESFQEYWSIIKNITSRNDNKILFLRGQANGDYKKIIPGVFRDDSIDEQNEYRQIQIEYPEEFNKNSHLSNLVKMQHYGCNTRLLDFSLNPLVALYFACEFEFEKNGKVFVIPVEKEQILFQNSDRALMLSCLPAFSKEDKNKLKQFCEKHPRKITDQDIQDCEEMQRFLHEIRGEYPAFKTAIIGKDLLSYYFIRPHKDNERMKSQDGAFAIFGLNEDKSISGINEKAITIEIDAFSKKRILEELEILRINGSIIYPGVERRAMLTRNKIPEWKNK